MLYIYIDESGDLGFNIRKTKPPSHYFTLSAIVVKTDKENKKISRIPKKIRQRKLKKKHKNKPELKFSNSNKTIRKAILKKIVNTELEIHSLTMYKRKVNKELQKKPDVLNNYLLKELLEKCLSAVKTKKINIYIDRCMAQEKQEELRNYIIYTCSKMFYISPQINIYHVDSRKKQAIQVADFVAGAIQYRYSHGLEKDNFEYFNILKEKLKHKEYFM